MNLLIVECAAMFGTICLIIIEGAHERHEEQKWQEPIKHIGTCPICHRKAYLTRLNGIWTVACSASCQHNCWEMEVEPEFAMYEWRLWAGTYRAKATHSYDVSKR